MKKLLFIVALVLAFFLWVLFSPPADGGYLLIAFGSKTIEMSLWFAALLIVGAWFCYWLTRRIFSGSYSAVRHFSDFLVFGNERAQKRTLSGLVDYIEGNWSQARKKLLRAAPKVEAPLINYLAAARSAYEMGDRVEAEKLLESAKQSSPDAELAVALTQARMDLLSKNYDRCLATLLRIKTKAPQNPVLLDLLRQVYFARQDWDALNGIFDRLRSFKIGSTEELNRLELIIHGERLKRVGAEARGLLQGDRLARLKTVWDKLPAHVQKNSDIVTIYVRQLALNSEEQEAEQLTRKALNNEWHVPLVYLYGRIRGRDIKQQLRQAEEWLKPHPKDAYLLLTVGRLSLRNELWGSARDYLTQSLQIKPEAETYAELARLLENMGERQSSMDFYQKALNLTTEGLPELPMPKGRL